MQQAASSGDVQQNGGSQTERGTQRQHADMREREAVREEDREKLDQHKDTHGIQIIHRLDKQLARQRQTGELTRTWRLTDKKTCRQAGRVEEIQTSMQSRWRADGPAASPHLEDTLAAKRS